MTPELLPCPFCGGEANPDGHARYTKPLVDTRWADGSEITECFFVNCIRCGIDNGRPGLVGGYQTRAEAIAAWNTRAGIPDPAAYVAAFEDMMEILDLVLKMNPNSSRDYVAITATVIRVLTAARQARGGV